MAENCGEGTKIARKNGNSGNFINHRGDVRNAESGHARIAKCANAPLLSEGRYTTAGAGFLFTLKGKRERTESVHPWPRSARSRSLTVLTVNISK